jgi:decaprenyl-phosphate phosphoribosyltransferase
MSIKHYVDIARVDHWFKNIFMLPGMAAALIMEPSIRDWTNLWPALIGVLSTCIVASSNYVINEILDAKTDRFHPLKCQRPLACGKISPGAAYAEWLLLAVVGLGLAALVSKAFFLCAAWLWVMGILYNVPPMRTKDKPYLDVLSEAVNNPIRMLLGWYAVGALSFPPSSLLFAYWMVGAFLMTAKRLAEYRLIGDPVQAGKYRSSFMHYTEEALATGMVVYASGFMFFVAVLIAKYHVELILSCPFLMAYLAYYTKLTYQKDSIVQTPEKLVTHKPLMAFTVFITLIFIGLALVNIPSLSAWLGIGGRGW